MSWPSPPSPAVEAFAKAHPDPEAGALLLWAISSAEALHYLYDLDGVYDATRSVSGGHHADTVDVAHARWASGTSITALDLGAAALARALGGHSGSKELDLGNFASGKPSKALQSIVSRLPPLALGWIQGVMADPAFVEMKAVRDALTHRRLPRHLYASVDSAAPDARLDLQVGSQRLPVRQVIANARDLATRHIVDLLQLLPKL